MNKSLKQFLKDRNLNIIDCVFLPIILLAVSSIFIISLPKTFDFNIKAFFVILTFLVNFIVFVIFLIKSLKKYHFSINSLVWIFGIFFFVFAPVIQFLNNAFPLPCNKKTSSLIFANTIILIFSLIYQFSYTKFQNKKCVKNDTAQAVSSSVTKTKVERNIRLKVLDIFTALSSAVLIMMFLRIDAKDVFSRIASMRAFSIASIQSVTTLFEMCARYCVVLTFIFNLIAFFKYRKRWPQLLISSICLLVVCFPFSLARFGTASIYMGIFIIFFPKTRDSKLFIYLFILALVFVFPVLGHLRKLSFFDLDFFKLLFKMMDLRGSYLTGEYDAYSNLLRAMEYVDINGLTFGWQLLGVVLFFVPRFMWPSKPIGSGAMVAEAFKEDFTNLSMPFIGEGYINFGIVGVIIFAIILGYISSMLDANYWENKSMFWFVLYPLLLPLMFFLLRGDLLSSFAQLVGVTVIYTGIYFAVFKANKPTQKTDGRVKKDGNILYVSSACSEKEYEAIFKGSEKRISLQSQKFNRLFMEGFAFNDCDVTAISSRPVNPALHPHKWYRKKEEQINKVKYIYLPFFNLKFIRQVCVYYFAKKEIAKWIKQNPNGYIVCDILNYTLLRAISVAIKGTSARLVSIVTDMPEISHSSNKSNRLNKHYKLVQNSDYFVLLSKYMSEKINPHKRPEIIIEGLCDIDMKDRNNMLEDKYEQKVVMYTGLLHKKYGIENLVNAFIEAKVEDSQLHIYGSGDWEQELIKVCETHKNIKYFGTRENQYVVKEQMKATLLVNPRPTNEEFVYYSFPSKNIEYLASGTPMLTTNLPSMPDEYNDYCFIAKDFDKQALKDELINILSKPKLELYEMGLKAQNWVISNKNNKAQAKKIMELLNQNNKEQN